MTINSYANRGRQNPVPRLFNKLKVGGKKMIQISSLWSLEDIEDFYYVVDENTVINSNTGRIKKATKSKQRGYWYYTLQKKDKTNKKVYVHKINALAFINNGPYELIEHIDDNKDNNKVNNLLFSNKSKNAKSAFKNNKINRKEKIIEIITFDNEIHQGTIKELSKKLNIPKGTLYDNLYVKRKSKHFKELKLIE